MEAVCSQSQRVSPQNGELGATKNRLERLEAASGAGPGLRETASKGNEWEFGRVRKDATHESTCTEFLSTCKSSWASGLTGREIDSLNQVPLKKALQQVIPCCYPRAQRAPGFVCRQGAPSSDGQESSSWCLLPRGSWGIRGAGVVQGPRVPW